MADPFGGCPDRVRSGAGLWKTGRRLRGQGPSIFCHPIFVVIDSNEYGNQWTQTSGYTWLAKPDHHFHSVPVHFLHGNEVVVVATSRMAHMGEPFVFSYYAVVYRQNC